MKESTRMNKAYRQWCLKTYPDVPSAELPLRGKMYEVWCAAWMACKWGVV